MSGGVKLLLGCLGVLVVFTLAAVVVLYAVVDRAGDRVRDFVGGVERQAETERALRDLSQRHPFAVPPDEVVSAERAERFFAVTDDLWVELEPWADELADLSRRMEGRDEPSITDLAAGMRGMTRFMEGRVVFVSTLEEHGVSAEEYLWTGLSLIRAHEELERAEEDRRAPSENTAMARRYDDRLAELRQPTVDGRPTRGAVFHVAMLWGITDGSAWRAMGLDTLHGEYR